MPDEPIAPATTTTTPTVVTPPVTAPDDAPPDKDPNWLTPRLKREADSASKKARSALLAELGITDPEAAKEALKAHAAAIEAEKTAQTKLTEREKELKADRERLALLEAKNQEYAARDRALADAELATLTEAEKAIVKLGAGDDAAKTLELAKATKALRPAVDPAKAGSTVATTKTKAATAPPQNAPGSVTTSPPDRKAEYEALKGKNPTAAAQYLNRYEDEIYPRA